MAKSTRRARPPGELRRELQDQVDLLVQACGRYDGGFTVIAKHMAVSMRVLLHQTGHSRALLEQLSLRGFRFLDTARNLSPTNLLSEINLCVLQIGPPEPQYVPLCTIGGGPHPSKWVPFSEWWNKPVIKDGQRRTFSRRDLVTMVANTDGGGHVDPELDDAYFALSRENSLGWMFSKGDTTAPMSSPERPCIRQIAHELLETLKRKAIAYVKVSYSPASTVASPR